MGKTTDNLIEGLRTWPAHRVRELLDTRSARDVEEALQAQTSFNHMRLAALLSRAAEPHLEALAQRSATLTRQRFGNAIQFFAPLYVSNFCCNECKYCGFNCLTTDSERKALTLEEAEAEAHCLAEQGFSHILLVSGEDRTHVPPEYFAELAYRIRGCFASIQVEIYSLSREEYALLVAAGVDGVTMFQESYEPEVYAAYHVRGPKSDYRNRLDSMTRAAQAGVTFLGLGVLLGINDWRVDSFYLGLHADFLQRHFWRSAISLSFPRMRPAHGSAPADCPVSDRALVQMMCALRLQLPDAVMTLSTREHPFFREQLVKLAVTKISAGAKTTPGGYSTTTTAEAQFDVADQRTLLEVASAIKAAGFDPVMKDWDRAYVTK